MDSASGSGKCAWGPFIIGAKVGLFQTMHQRYMIRRHQLHYIANQRRDLGRRILVLSQRVKVLKLADIRGCRVQV